MFTDILGWLWHQLVYDLAEKANVSTCIIANTGDEFSIVLTMPRYVM
jgi:hypothetical protein